jgi:hypothetical protein
MIAAGAPSEDIGIGASEPHQAVVSCASVEHVGRHVTSEIVVQRVAGAIDRSQTGQREILDIGTETVAHGALHAVGALVHLLDHAVAGVVHEIGIVAGAADQRIDTETAVQDIVRPSASQNVGQIGAVSRHRLLRRPIGDK